MKVLFDLQTKGDSSKITIKSLQLYVQVNKTSGELAVGPNLAAIREFTAPIRVWIKDGLNKAEATLTIEVKMVTDEALENAIVLTVVRQNLEQFLQGLFIFLRVESF